MTKQHSEITLSFMIPGHTKFSPDWCSGLLKKYRRMKVGGLSDLCSVVNDSAAVNIAQPTGLEDGSVVVTTYNWQEFCTKVKGIKKLHHLRFPSSSPGFIFVKERAGDTEVKRSILKDANWKPQAGKLPPVLPPSGLSLQWLWYLYEKIREFCPDHLKDTGYHVPTAWRTVCRPFSLPFANATYSASYLHHHHYFYYYR